MKKLSEEEIEKRMEALEGWEYVDNAIQTSFEFENFRETFSMMTLIAFECEAQEHHPDWNNEYNILYISLSTHEAGGVTEKDFKLAHSIEDIIDSE